MNLIKTFNENFVMVLYLTPIYALVKKNFNCIFILVELFESTIILNKPI